MMLRSSPVSLCCLCREARDYRHIKPAGLRSFCRYVCVRHSRSRGMDRLAEHAVQISVDVWNCHVVDGRLSVSGNTNAQASIQATFG